MKNILKITGMVLIYFALFILGSSSGLIHPACYAYVGTILPLGFAFLYLATASTIRTFGAAALLNGILLIGAVLLGEGNPAFIAGMIVLTALAEIIRKICGYEKLLGVRLSFLPFALSFYTYTAHWWTDTEHSLEEGAEMFGQAYADQMKAVIGNIPMLIVMVVLAIPVAFLGMILAEKIMKRSAAKLS